MPKITYIDFKGCERRFAVQEGTTVMQGAIENGVPGIDGDCGGECACGTCHVYVDPEWLEKTGKRTAGEEALLDMSIATKPNSRLGCRIKMTDALDGLRVQTPAGQH